MGKGQPTSQQITDALCDACSKIEEPARGDLLSFVGAASDDDLLALWQAVKTITGRENNLHPGSSPGCT